MTIALGTKTRESNGISSRLSTLAVVCRIISATSGISMTAAAKRASRPCCEVTSGAEGCHENERAPLTLCLTHCAERSAAYLISLMCCSVMRQEQLGDGFVALPDCDHQRRRHVLDIQEQTHETMMRVRCKRAASIGTLFALISALRRISSSTTGRCPSAHAIESTKVPTCTCVRQSHRLSEYTHSRRESVRVILTPDSDH